MSCGVTKHRTGRTGPKQAYIGLLGSWQNASLRQHVKCLKVLRLLDTFHVHRRPRTTGCHETPHRAHRAHRTEILQLCVVERGVRGEEPRRVLPARII